MVGKKLEAIFKPAATRATQVIGELESDVMGVLWASGKRLPVRDVRERLAGNGRDLAYNTVMTVLVRLAEKGLVRREKADDVWHYEATLSEPEFRARASGEVLRELLELAPEATLPQLVDVLAESEPGALDELARLIEERRTRADVESQPA